MKGSSLYHKTVRKAKKSGGGGLIMDGADEQKGEEVTLGRAVEVARRLKRAKTAFMVVAEGSAG